jgi:hypothetical protein
MSLADIQLLRLLHTDDCEFMLFSWKGDNMMINARRQLLGNRLSVGALKKIMNLRISSSFYYRRLLFVELQI